MRAGVCVSVAYELTGAGSSKRGPVGDATQELDHAVGQLMEGVAEMGLDEDTVWFFTSDNGSPLGNDGHGNGRE